MATVIGSDSLSFSLAGFDFDPLQQSVIRSDLTSDRNVVVAGSLDFNGDGFDDLLLLSSAPFNFDLGDAPNDEPFIQVVFGSPQGLPANFDLDEITSSTGVRAIDLTTFLQSDLATAINAVNDINGDGFDEIYLPDDDALFSSTYTSILLFGTRSGELPFGVNLDNLRLTEGFVLNAPAPNGYGYQTSVVSAGDVNGDGIDDFLIGARYDYDTEGSTATNVVYVVFGSDREFAAESTLPELDGTNGYRIVLQPLDSLPTVVGPGDVDGDGVDDILIADVGRYFDDQASYLVFGGAQALADLDAADGEVDGRIFVEGAVDTPSVILAPSRLTIGEDFTSRIGVAISDTNRFDEASLVGAVGVALDADLGELTIDAETSRLVFTPGTAVDGLDAGEVLRGRYRITAEDGGETIVALTILGSDDGDAGNNRLIGSRAADRIEGLEGDDVITGAAGRDLLDGGLGNDVLIGGDGDDRLFGGADNDVLIGGLGADTLTGGEGIDTTSYVQATSAVRADLRGLQAGFGEAEGDLFSGVERLIGSAHDDGLRGDALANTLIGLGGDDNLFAFAGDDFITGGDGNDLIFGGIGADVLRGDAGADTLIGARLTIA